jgi:hypothetical protein
MMKKTFIAWLAIIAVLASVFFIIEDRKFIRINEKKYITVWKIFGRCFIMPYKYYGLIRPDKNYIETTALNTVTIIYDRNSSADLVLFNNLNEPLNYNFDLFRLKFYTIDKQNEFFKKYYCENMVCSEYNYVIIYSRENSYFVNGHVL